MKVDCTKGKTNAVRRRGRSVVIIAEKQVRTEDHIYGISHYLKYMYLLNVEGWATSSYRREIVLFFSAGLILYDRVFIFYEDSLFTVGNLFRIFILRKLLLWKYEILLTNALRVTSGATCWRMQFQHVFFWCGFADFFHSFNYSFSDNVWESTHLVLPKTQLHLSSGDTHVFFFHILSRFFLFFNLLSFE